MTSRADKTRREEAGPQAGESESPGGHKRGPVWPTAPRAGLDRLTRPGAAHRRFVSWLFLLGIALGALSSRATAQPGVTGAPPAPAVTAAMPEPARSGESAELWVVVQRLPDFKTPVALQALREGFDALASALSDQAIRVGVLSYDNEPPAINADTLKLESLDKLAARVAQQLERPKGKSNSTLTNESLLWALALLQSTNASRRYVLLISNGSNRNETEGGGERIGKSARHAGIQVHVLYYNILESNSELTRLVHSSQGRLYPVPKSQETLFASQLREFARNLRQDLLKPAAKPAASAASTAGPRPRPAPSQGATAADVPDAMPSAALPRDAAKPQSRLGAIVLVLLLGGAVGYLLLRRPQVARTAWPGPDPTHDSLPTAGVETPTPADRPAGLLLSLTAAHDQGVGFAVPLQGLRIGDQPDCTCYVSSRGKRAFACQIRLGASGYLLQIPAGVEVSVEAERVENEVMLRDNMRFQIEGALFEFKQTELSGNLHRSMPPSPPQGA